MFDFPFNNKIMQIIDDYLPDNERLTHRFHYKYLKDGLSTNYCRGIYHAVQAKDFRAVNELLDFVIVHEQYSHPDWVTKAMILFLHSSPSDKSPSNLEVFQKFLNAGADVSYERHKIYCLCVTQKQVSYLKEIFRIGIKISLACLGDSILWAFENQQQTLMALLFKQVTKTQIYTHAVRKGHVNFVKWMMYSNNNIIEASKRKKFAKLYNCWPFWKSIKRGNVNMLRLLFDQVPDKREKCSIIRNRGTYPLDLAVSYGHTNVVEYLLNNGACIYEGQHFPLLTATEREDVACVKMLLEHDADIWEQDCRCFHVAAGQGCMELVELFINQADENWECLLASGNYCAFRHAATNEHLPVLKFLMEKLTEDKDEKEAAKLTSKILTLFSTPIQNMVNSLQWSLSGRRTGSTSTTLSQTERKLFELDVPNPLENYSTEQAIVHGNSYEVFMYLFLLEKGVRQTLGDEQKQEQPSTTRKRKRVKTGNSQNGKRRKLKHVHTKSQPIEDIENLFVSRRDFDKYRMQTIHNL